MTHTDNAIRQMILSNPEKVRELLLTNAARNILMTVAQDGDAGVTAAEWVRRFDDSIQSASQKLKSLWGKGYLTREEMASPSGGIHHLYKINEELGL
jgi:predicted transcriptional regulator